MAVPAPEFVPLHLGAAREELRRRTISLSKSDVARPWCGRRKFHELWANHSSQLASEPLELFGALYDVEREAREWDPAARRDIRQQKARPAADTLHAWLLAQRQRVPDGSATAKAIDYSLGRWAALTRYLDDGAIPIDNN